MMRHAMEWIKSGGGPLICVDEIWARCWRGVMNSSSQEPNEQRHTDYERACAVKDYVVDIKTDGGHALVLGDMPLETSVWSRNRTTIVRLFYADARTDFDNMLSTIGDEAFQNPIESTSYQVTSGRVVIFDSAVDGQDQGRKMLKFDIAGGRYEILTATVKPDSRTSLLLHRFFHIT
jgi:hypothetical protein